MSNKNSGKVIYLNESSTSPPKQNWIINQDQERELKAGYSEQAAAHSGGNDDMDDSTKMILERLERDSREREARYHADAREREQRSREDTAELKQFIREQNERFDKSLEEARKGFKADFTDLKSEFKELRAEFRDLKTSTDGTNKWIIGLAITTIIAIVAIAVAVWVQ